MGDAPLIFFHIPKTGGQTLGAIMLRQYPMGSVFDLWLQKPETFSNFNALTSEEKKALRGLNGHMPFGFHTQLAPGAQYITMLRDPIKRVLSEYAHLSQDPEDWGVWKPPKEALVSVDAYLDYLIDSNMTNGQTRLLAGDVDPDDRPPLRPLSPDALVRAKNNLSDHFAVVGQTERFEESVLLMKQVLGWTKHIYYMRRNVRAQFARNVSPSQTTLARIAEYTQDDAQLVELGARLLDDQIRANGKALDVELKKLRRVNRSLEGILRVAHAPAVRKLRSVPGIRQVWELASGIVTRVA